MKISYQKRGDVTYAKLPGQSYRVDGKVRKKNVVYLGRVIDKKNNVFYNKERGIFTYDPDTDTYGKADERYVSELKTDGRKRQRVCLDFGDSYFIDALIRSMHYDTVLDQMNYRNKDTLYAMVQYYLITNSSNAHAETWLSGNYASLLYPNANLTSQRISDFLESVGRDDNMMKYFKAHIGWLMEYVSKDPAVIVDSTGLPNNIHFPLTEISSHNGKVSREVRMETAIQRDSGYPLMFKANAGNIVDQSIVTRTVNTLLSFDVHTDFLLLDAGFYNNENIDQLYFANIDFLTRFPAKYSLYNEIVKKHGSSLKVKKNLVEYCGRYVYLERFEVKIGEHKDQPAYLYLGYDIERAGEESHKLLKKAAKDKKSVSAVHKELTETGYFVLISSLPFESEEILPAYYVRQTVEQYFDISKGSSKLTPLRVHSEDALNGHLILSQIAATINVYIQKITNQIYDNREEMLMAMRNQKCMVFNDRITTSAPQAKANEFYNAFSIKCPLYIERKGGKLTPQYTLPKINPDEV